VRQVLTSAVRETYIFASKRCTHMRESEMKEEEEELKQCEEALKKQEEQLEKRKKKCVTLFHCTH
jgi:hypothetical protein